MNQAIRFKFGTQVEDGPFLRMYHKKTPSGRGWGHVTKFQNLGTPYNFRTDRGIRFKFGT